MILVFFLILRILYSYEGSESARDNFGKLIHQFQP